MKITVLIALCFLGAWIPAKAIVGDDSFENCEFLGNNRLQVSWTLRQDANEINFQLCGCSGMEASTTNEYMGFGLSGNPAMTRMLGADATIAYVDEDTGPVAEDYFLSAYDQCDGEGNGACPDTMTNGCRDDVRNISGFRRTGFQCVAFTRSLTSEDTTCDLNFNTNAPQAIVWAVGGVGSTAFKHYRRAEMSESLLEFGRAPDNNCPGGLICPDCPAFEESVFDVTGRDATFVARIGPPANPRGYMSIADQAGWGIAWFLNGSLIPRLIVERGYTYTFVSLGGREGETNYHPFYLSDSKRGGFLRKSEAQMNAETIFAGFDAEGNPQGVGPYCEVTEDTTATNILNTCGSQEDYISSLDFEGCPMEAEAGRFSWTPDDTTPNNLYYQCATHTNLGYRITVTGGNPILPSSGRALVAYATSTLLMLILTLLAF